MSESGDRSEAGTADDASRPLFDPARERAIERERAHERRENGGRERSGGSNASAGESAGGSRTQRSAETEGTREALGGGSTADSGARSRSRSRSRSDSGSRFASASDVTGRGVGLTLLAALLCALGYYGVLGFQATGVQVFGSVVPVPFYTLTYSVLFVFSLVPRAHGGLRALSWSIVFSLVFGTLMTIGTEGAFYLADNPDLATTGYTGVTVLALAVVVASITYWGVLSVAKTA